MQAKLVITLLRDRQARAALVTVALFILCLPILLAACVAGFLSHEVERNCAGSSEMGLNEPVGGGALGSGLYAQPLTLQQGRWYEVGATTYGGPSDPTSGQYGSIPDPGQGYLPGHPQSFAELSVLNSNPANGGTFTFQDANALDRLPYLTALRVVHGRKQLVLEKRDTGYGQGPDQFIGNGEPYRLDVWWQAAQQLGISKDAVRIQLAPPGGAAATLSELPASEATEAGGEAGNVCAAGEGGGEVPLPLTPGERTKILPSGLAAAGESAPDPVKRMVAAGNRLYGRPYIYGGGHGPSLDTLQPGYDCSSAVSYVLHGGKALGPYALDSTGLTAYGDAGPGKWVTIYANAAHAFMYVGSLRFDTVESYDTGPNAGKQGPRWRVYPTVPDWSTWVVRHPPGL